MPVGELARSLPPVADAAAKYAGGHKIPGVNFCSRYFSSSNNNKKLFRTTEIKKKKTNMCDENT